MISTVLHWLGGPGRGAGATTGDEVGFLAGRRYGPGLAGMGGLSRTRSTIANVRGGTL
jgi:hypothetical protein